MRSLPIIGRRLRNRFDGGARDRALTAVADALVEVGRTRRLRASRARILFVDYLTLLPRPGVDAPPLSKSDADVGRHVAETLERHTAEAAAATGCQIVRARGQPRSPCVVGRSLDDQGCGAASGPPVPVSPHRRRVACRRRTSRRAGVQAHAIVRCIIELKGLTEVFGRRKQPPGRRFDHNRSTAAS
jgi:hypothetical protein